VCVCVCVCMYLCVCVQASYTPVLVPSPGSQEWVLGLMEAMECACCFAIMGVGGVPIVAFNCGHCFCSRGGTDSKKSALSWALPSKCTRELTSENF
jgi:hypothetical protein